METGVAAVMDLPDDVMERVLPLIGAADTVHVEHTDEPEWPGEPNTLVYALTDTWLIRATVTRSDGEQLAEHSSAIAIDTIEKVEVRDLADGTPASTIHVAPAGGDPYQTGVPVKIAKALISSR